MAGTRDPDDLWGGMSVGMTITSYLLAGVLVWGGLGYVVDHLVGTPKVFTAAGMIVGAALSIYLVYLRYGKERDEGKP